MTTNYVVGFLFTTDKQNVILISKLKPEWQKNKLNGVGGKIENSETAEEAMVREFKEETGLLIKDWSHYCTLGDLNYTWNVQFFRTFTNSLIPLPYNPTNERVDWYKVEQLDTYPLIPNLKWLIPLALDKDRVVATVWDPSIINTG